VKDPDSPICQTIAGLLQRIGDKWSALVVQTLADGSMRFNEIRRAIPSVSQRMLTLTLRNLERDGLVNRTVTPSIPPRVDYELTELGHSLETPICGLVRWSMENVGAIQEAQERYDREQAESEAA
jgi:DNA-binding HxlR family transcriptional regulator